MRDNPLLAVAAVLAPLSLMSVGGGQSVLAEMHRQMVVQHGWLSEMQFLNDYVVTRLLPGPSSLIVLLAGTQIAGWLGGLVAVLAMFVPSSLLVVAVARLWARHEGAPWRASVEQGLAPVAAGLILATALTLVRGLQGGWPAWALAGAATLGLMRFRLHPFLLLAAGAVLLTLWSVFGARS